MSGALRINASFCTGGGCTNYEIIAKVIVNLLSTVGFIFTTGSSGCLDNQEHFAFWGLQEVYRQVQPHRDEHRSGKSQAPGKRQRREVE